MRSSALERYLSRSFTIEPRVAGSARNPKIHLVIVYRARKCNGVTLTTWSASSFGSPITIGSEKGNGSHPGHHSNSHSKKQPPLEPIKDYYRV